MKILKLCTLLIFLFGLMKLCCGQLACNPNIPHGTVDRHPTDRSLYTCDEGYRPHPNITRLICSSGSHWEADSSEWTGVFSVNILCTGEDIPQHYRRLQKVLLISDFLSCSVHAWS